MVRRHHICHTWYIKRSNRKIAIGTHKIRKRRLQSKQEKIKVLSKRNSTAGTHHQEKTEAVNKLNPTTNTKTLKFFMGAIQYCAKLIPNPSKNTDNMRQLLKKDTKWELTRERNTDFNNIKKELNSQPCLAH